MYSGQGDRISRWEDRLGKTEVPDRLLESGRVIHSAPMTTFGRNLTLNLAAVPLELGDEADLRDVCRVWRKGLEKEERA
ncbi:MAG: hypothetical protein ACC613_03660 [Synergistales bacterium]